MADPWLDLVQAVTASPTGGGGFYGGQSNAPRGWDLLMSYASSEMPSMSGGRLRDLVDRTEGGGGYDTLFGFSNRSGPFSGVDVSRMTIGQLKDFSSPSGQYGAWVKNKIGRVATPMGRYQIVGTTLRGLADEMGLSDDTVFDENTQDAMFDHLVQRRLSRASSPEAKLAGLRAEWEGFKHVSDAALLAAASEYEG